MVSTFDMQKLTALLQDFHRLTGIRITIFNDSFTELCSYPQDIAPVCRFIRTNPDAAAACRECDRRACRKAAALRAPHIYQCHAGLTEAVTPVCLGNLVVAYLLFGHLFSYPTQYAGWQAVSSACDPYGLNEEKLRDHVLSLPVTSKETILAASHILEAVASYLCMERLITLRQQDFPARLDAYLQEHFTEEISAETICDHFGVGKTFLYKTASKNYGRGIAEEIRSLRVEHAKKLLTEHQELTIAEIAGQSGFSDYNYFITVFRKLTGTTPLRYRRQAADRP